MTTHRPEVSCTCRIVPNCCKVVRVPVTHRDLVRLSRGTGQLPCSFIEWLAPDEIDMAGEPESFVELDVGRRLMVLRHADGACHLLTPEGRCKAYVARPAPCAAYPCALSDPTGDHQPRRLYVLPDAPCQDANVALDDLARMAVECVETELNQYVLLVSQWNRLQRRRRLAGRRAKSAADFLDYLTAQSRSTQAPSS